MLLLSFRFIKESSRFSQKNDAAQLFSTLIMLINVSWGANHHIRVIFEGHWSNDAQLLKIILNSCAWDFKGSFLFISQKVYLIWYILYYVTLYVLIFHGYAAEGSCQNMWMDTVDVGQCTYKHSHCAHIFHLHTHIRHPLCLHTYMHSLSMHIHLDALSIKPLKGSFSIEG